jgi:hypothetical protein
MKDTVSRREALGASATTVLGALAGCSGFGLLDGDSGGDWDAWVYDPRKLRDSDSYNQDLRMRSPSKLASVESSLRPETERLASPIYVEADVFDDVSNVDWSASYRDPQFNQPGVLAHGGSFDVDVARTASGALFDASPDAAESVGTIGDFEIARYTEDDHAAYRDGEAVAVGGATTDTTRSIVDRRLDDETIPGTGSDAVKSFLGHFESDHVVNARFTWDGDRDVPGCSGFGYTVHGETTTARLVDVRLRTEDDLETLAEEIDALRDVTVESDGEVVALSGTVDTDRTALNGSMFRLREAPFE